MRFVFFLAWRLLNVRAAKNRKTHSLTITTLIVATIGVTVPVTILSIQNGYMTAITERWAALSFHNQVEARDIENYPKLVEKIYEAKLSEELINYAKKEGGKHLRGYYNMPPIAQDSSKEYKIVSYVLPWKEIYGMVSTPDNIYQTEIRAVPSHFFSHPSIASVFVFEAPQATPLTKDTELLLGKGLARRLGIEDITGETIVNISIPLKNSRASSSQITTKPFIVRGIFHTGYQEIDDNISIMLLSAGKKLTFNNNISKIGVLFKDINYQHIAQRSIIDIVSQHIDENFMAQKDTDKLFFPPATVHRFSDFHGHLMVALDWEKSQLTIVTIALIFVAFFSIGLNLYASATYKRRDIAILMAIGTHQRHIEMIFILQGIFLAMIGIGLGIGIGAIILPRALSHLIFIINEILNIFSWVAEIIGAEWNSTFYQVGSNAIYNPDDLPYSLLLGDMLFLVCVGVLIAAIFSWFPARQAAKIQPIRTLKND